MAILGVDERSNLYKMLSNNYDHFELEKEAMEIDYNKRRIDRNLKIKLQKDTKKTEDVLTHLISSLDKIIKISFENSCQALSGNVVLIPLLEKKITDTIHRLTGLHSHLKESNVYANTIHPQP